MDKSGTIEIKELGSVAAKLGKEIPPEQLASMVKNLDSNKDGKISYGEFEYWWSKGIEGKMMELVYLKSQALKLTNFVKKKAEQLGISFEVWYKLIDRATKAEKNLTSIASSLISDRR